MLVVGQKIKGISSRIQLIHLHYHFIIRPRIRQSLGPR